MNQALRALIESPVADIHRAARDLTLDPALQYYARILSHYLKGDTEELRAIIGEHLDFTHPLAADLRDLGQMRLKVRESKTAARDLKPYHARAFPDVLEAEKFLILGIANDRAKEYLAAARYFERAAALYKLCECPRKALRAYYNVIASESLAVPYKNFVADYQSVIEIAQNLGELSFKGMALTMLSREYQIIGLHDQALAMAQQGLRDLEPERGAIHHYHAILHLAHLLIEAGRLDEAKPLLLETEMATFPEIQAARRFLLALSDPRAAWRPEWEEDLLPTWRNRLPALGERIQAEGRDDLTDLESRLLKLMYNGPLNKWELITHLYPEQAPALVLENRFKNLLARVRKKFPELVVCRQGRYSLKKLPPGGV